MHQFSTFIWIEFLTLKLIKMQWLNLLLSEVHTLSACSRTDLHTVQHNAPEFSPSHSGSLSRCPGQTETVESFCGFSSPRSGPLVVLCGPLLSGLPLKSQHSKSEWNLAKFIWCIISSMILSTGIYRHTFMMHCQ